LHHSILTFIASSCGRAALCIGGSLALPAPLVSAASGPAAAGSQPVKPVADNTPAMVACEDRRRPPTRTRVPQKSRPPLKTAIAAARQPALPRLAAGLSPYLRIARPDHWIKNIFVVPGAAAALAIAPPASGWRVWPLALALVGVCLLASANYTINEFLDAAPDRHHPQKHARPAASGLVDGRLVLAEYLLLAGTGLAAAAAINRPFALAGLALLVMGVVYNAPPLRTKDIAYLDVLSESVNNPLRFLLGWFAVTGDFLPPASALLAYWMGGAFLMAIKRYSEYRGIADPARAALYRRSFRRYSEQSLLLSGFFFALCSAFFTAIFLIKYRIEFLLTFPLFATLFTWYVAIALKSDSAAQAPEKMHREVAFLCFAAFTFLVAAALFVVDLPFLHGWMEPFLLTTGGVGGGR
jgi:4-hydroxybenzoate polyprenyltransferase